jgi:hypothetical protein
LGRFSEKIGYEKLRSWRIRGVWLVVLMVLSFLLDATLDHFGIVELFWPILVTISISVFTICGPWELKKRIWFWATFAAVVAVHVSFFHFMGWSWGRKWVPAITIAGFCNIDLFAVFALIYFIEKLIDENPNVRPRLSTKS